MKSKTMNSLMVLIAWVLITGGSIGPPWQRNR